jgi:photosystem II stability/assembly factor-like uncharacterized protein
MFRKMLYASAFLLLVVRVSLSAPGDFDSAFEGDRNIAYNNASITTLDYGDSQFGKSYGKLPLHFEVNQGQADSQVKFLARGSGYTLFLTPTEVVLALRKLSSETFSEKHPALKKRAISKNVGRALVRIKFANPSPETKVEGLEELHGKVNYFHGNDPERWHTNIPTYARVKYERIYPGIDLIFYGSEHQLEYDFLVFPGANPDAIGLDIEGADKLEINDLGDLIIHTSVSELRLRKPFVYQEIDGIKHTIASRYVTSDKRRVGFRFGIYDSSKPLVIDPVLSYSTYLGGKGDDYGEGIAVDPSGNVYITGLTSSADFLSQNPIQTANGSGVFKTVDGGSNWNAVNEGLTNNNIIAIAIDPVTPSRLYAGTKDGLFKSIDTGTSWSPVNTELPTSEIIAVAIDPVTPTTVYVSSSVGGLFKSTNAGDTWNPINTGLTSNNILVLAIDPVTPATIYAGTGWGLFKSTNGGESWIELNLPESFDKHIRSIAIAPLNPTTLYTGANMGALHKSTDGGENWESAPIVIPAGEPVSALAIDSAAPMTLYAGVGAGVYKSIDGAKNWEDVLGAGADINALIIDPKTPTTLYAGTYGKGVFKSIDGGENWSVVNAGLTNKSVSAVAIDPTATMRLYAGTNSGGLFDVFVVKLNPTDFSPVYSTYIGGSDDDYGRGIAVDSTGNAYLSGYTTSKDFPVTEGAFQTSAGGSGDAFILKLNPEGSALVYSTYLGGLNDDQAYGIALDSAGNAYVTGNTGSANFPVTEGAFNTINGAGVFVSKLNAIGSALVYSTYLGGGSANGIAVDYSGMACVTGATYSRNFPTTPGAYQPNKSNDPSTDAYLTKFNAAGSALVYSTYLGGHGKAYSLAGSGVAFDSGGNAYVTGSGLYLGTYDAFGYKLTEAGSIQPYGYDYGFFRFDGDQFAHGITVDASGNILITGRTHSPTYDCDAFIAKLDTSGKLSIFLLGGSLFDEGSAIAADSFGNVYLTGNTASRNFPTTEGALQVSFGGGLYDSFIVKISGIAGSDNIPPMPNPMTWETEETVPHQTGTDSITMVATTATDPTPPISYYFDFVGSPTGGLGGADSGWQEGTSYTNSNLRANHKYGYRVKARDELNNQTAYSTTKYAYTAIQTPTGITFGTITSTSIQARSTNTPTGLSWGSSGLWIENMTKTTNSGWKRDNTPWTSKSLTPNTSYSFQAKARNGDGKETRYNPPAPEYTRYTRANLPGRASFSDLFPTSIRANWTVNNNPPGTRYFCENVTARTSSGWITETSWNSDNLTCGISYSFRVKARNEEGIETGWTSLGSPTVKCIILRYPNGGEMIPSGSSYDIQWDTIPEAVSFDLFYSLDNGVSWPLIKKDERNTVCPWQVPKTTGNKKACFVKVIGYNDARTKRIGSDTSDKPFTIEVVTVTNPNGGGEPLHAGNPFTIEWRGCSDAVTFDLMVSFNNGATWYYIDDKSTPGVIEGKGVTGTSFTTKVPSPGTGNSKTCFIKVIAYNEAGKKIGSDTSDKPFTIEVVKLTSPNGGDPPLKQNDTVDIKWTAYETSQPITKVQLFYTKDAGVTWNSIPGPSGTSYPPGDYTQSWTVPWVGTAPKTKCKVKVVLKDVKGVIRGSDVSDNFFTIEP